MTQESTSVATSKMAWARPGVETVVPGVHRIVLPLPMDALTAVNIYAVEGDGGLLLVDGGWSVPEGRAELERALSTIGFGLSDIVEIVVTHGHRDHYTMAAALREELGCSVRIGEGEREYLMRMREDPRGSLRQLEALRRCGAAHLQDEWLIWLEAQPRPTDAWGDPDRWLRDGDVIRVGEHEIRAVATSGHTRGHFVFADEARGLLFTGDHLLPTITPSVGFEPVEVHLPLRNYLRSLDAMLRLPDLRMLPAHGPVGMSSHERARALLEHHDARLAQTRAALRDGGTAYEVARELGWTRRNLSITEMAPYNAALAILETELHLDLLEAQGVVERSTAADGVVRYHHGSKGRDVVR